jgi:hypothetical protein
MVAVVADFWFYFPFELLLDLPPKSTLILYSLLTLPAGVLFGLVWVTLGSFLPSRLVATAEGLYIYTMGRRRLEIPFASVREVVMSRGWVKPLVLTGRTFLLRHREFNFNFGKESVTLRLNAGRPICLAVRDADRWADIVREGMARVSAEGSERDR